MPDNAFTHSAKQSGKSEEKKKPVAPMGTGSGSNAQEIQMLRNRMASLEMSHRNMNTRIDEIWELVFTQAGFKSGFGSMVHIVKQLDKASVELRNIMIEVLTNPGEDVNVWVKRLNSYYTQFPEYEPKPEDLVDDRDSKNGETTNGK